MPRGGPNEIILHVNLRDLSNQSQQEAVGILGVNLIDAAFHALGTPEAFLANLFEDLGLQRAEIDCLECNGPVFEGWDRNEIHVSLVAGGYAEAVVFPADNQLVPANELLYKRLLVLALGGFDSVSKLHANPVRDTLAQVPKGELAETKGRLGLFLTVLLRVLDDRYRELPGTLLEGIARLFMQNVRVKEVRRRVELASLTGWRWKEKDGMIAADDLYPPEPLDHLYRYLLSSKFIIPEKPASERSSLKIVRMG